MSGFGDVMKNILNWQPAGSPEWARIQDVGQNQQRLNLERQQEQIQEAQEQRAAQEFELNFHQALTQRGALPVVNGLVQRPLGMQAGDYSANMSAPTTSGGDQPPGWASGAGPSPQVTSGAGPSINLPGQSLSGTLLDKADPARTVSFKDSTGKPVTYELPTLAQQLANQWSAGAPQRAGEVQQAQEMGRAQALGRGQGETEADLSNPRKKLVPLDDDTSDFYHLPHGLSVPQDTLEQMSSRATPAIIRGDTSITNNQNTNNTRKDIEAAREASRLQLEKVQDDNRNQRNQYTNQVRQSIANARNALTQSGQNGIQQRAASNALNRDEDDLLKTSKAADAEQERLNAAQALVDPNITPDGEQFKHPWTGTTQTMNPGWRQQIQGAIQRGTDNYNNLHSIEETIRQRYAAAGGGAAAGAGGKGASGGAGGTRPKINPATGKAYAAGDAVTLKNGQRVTITKMKPDGSFEYK